MSVCVHLCSMQKYIGICQLWHFILKIASVEKIYHSALVLKLHAALSLVWMTPSVNSSAERRHALLRGYSQSFCSWGDGLTHRRHSCGETRF